MKRPLFRQPSLQTLLTVAFTAAGAFITAAIILFLFNNFRNELRQEIRNRLVSITTIAALQQDGDTLVKVAARNDEYYNKINEQNLKIRASDPDLVFVYTMRKNEQGIYFVVDANLPGDEGIADFGELYEEPGPTLAENFDTLNRTIIEPDFYTDKYGTFLSAYAPIYASNGEKVGVLGVDITAKRILQKESRLLTQSLLVFLASLPVIALLSYFLARQLTIPLAQLTRSVQKIAEGNLNERVTESANSREAALLASSFNRMAQKLADLVNNLETQVAERTQKSEQRTSQLQAVSSVARAIASLQETSLLLPEITRLISEHFGFYHVGIFLLDEAHEFAVLQAANSEGGQRMLKRQHKLRLDTKSIVGYSASRGEPRIALDVGTDSVFFNNPDLPNTRSEMALPLHIGGRVIGVLDVQSVQPNAFTEEDIAVLTTLADQVAIAIENARLFSEARQALKESEQTFARYVKQEWSSFRRQVRNIGYLFDGQRAVPFEERNGRAQTATLPQTGRLSTEKDSGELVVPLRLKGQIIGIIKARPKSMNRKWTDDERILLEAAAERAALALENARLVDSAQRRAARERIISEISSKVGSVSEMDAIMQAAVEELGRRLGSAAEVTLELENEPT
ncbi:MAG: GAF domain-containing protein [Chloroflexota bacterium]|nr:GAF domain-containing protein [Chloroflexota bacterium]MBI5704214.1 GAF domain-containing protein [Chloroflexota bacterium]